jgi:hypothetical protein
MFCKQFLFFVHRFRRWTQIILDGIYGMDAEYFFCRSPPCNAPVAAGGTQRGKRKNTSIQVCQYTGAGLEIADDHDPDAGDDEPDQEAENSEEPEQELEAGVFDACGPVAGLQNDEYADRDVEKEADAGEPLAGTDFEPFLLVQLDRHDHREEHKEQLKIEEFLQPMRLVGEDFIKFFMKGKVCHCFIVNFIVSVVIERSVQVGK